MLSGRAAPLADPAAVHALEQALSGLGPQLARVGLLLKQTLLPAIPWVCEEGAERLTVSPEINTSIAKAPSLA